MDNFGSSDDLSKTIEKLMADEKFGEILAAVQSSFSANADQSKAISDSTESESVSETETANPATETAAEVKSPIAAMPQLSPELLSKLPEIISMLSANGDKGDGKKGDSRLADRKRLLHALKPFLSEHRRNAVDSIVNIAGIADLFGI